MSAGIAIFYTARRRLFLNKANELWKYDKVKMRRIMLSFFRKYDKIRISADALYPIPLVSSENRFKRSFWHFFQKSLMTLQKNRSIHRFYQYKDKYICKFLVFWTKINFENVPEKKKNWDLRTVLKDEVYRYVSLKSIICFR